MYGPQGAASILAYSLINGKNLQEEDNLSNELRLLPQNPAMLTNSTQNVDPELQNRVNTSLSSEQLGISGQCKIFMLVTGILNR